MLPANVPGGPSVKHLIEAVGVCIAESNVFTKDVMASCLKLLAQAEPLPILSMRTTIEALVFWPALAPFIIEMLLHLVGRGIWNSPPLWLGFIKCCMRAEVLPHSLRVLLALPKEQLTEVLAKEASLREPLTSYAATHLADVSAEALEVLGLGEGDEAEDLF